MRKCRPSNLVVWNFEYFVYISNSIKDGTTVGLLYVAVNQKAQLINIAIAVRHLVLYAISHEISLVSHC